MLQIPRLKLCTKCKIIKPFNMFHKNKCKKNGLTPSCKKCRKIYRDKESNKEYIKQYYKKNKQKINKTRKQYNHKNREKINKASREYHHKNKEKRNEVSREYRHKNKEEISKQRKEYY
ncbi:MAG: hypothetical protein U9O83_01065, partial [Campylobacterota bacterium]|nr:hypothetical protein [Campylobacterota bacterium]